MSRSEGDYDENFPNEGALWWANDGRALKGKRGRKALADLREALLALPEKRLISRALSTVGKDVPETSPTGAPVGYSTYAYADQRRLLAEQGEGVCAVGAYAWHQRVKAGADPLKAMQTLPLNADYDGDPWVTLRVGEEAGRAPVRRRLRGDDAVAVRVGEEAGLAGVLAWRLMSLNDDTFENLTPEQRYDAYLAWIDKQLAAEVSA